MWIGDNPSAERDAQIGADIVEPELWRKMVLRCPKRDGTTAQVEMLRPAAWLEARNVHAGGHVRIDVPECGIEGLADVLDVQPCPSITAGTGRVVTATFRHQAAQILDIAIEGESKPIGSTANHPFWSETKQEFVRADELSPGEQVCTADSTALVTSITPRGPPEPVYNLEVQFEHVYRVGDSGVLVHNGGLDILNPCFTPKFRREPENIQEQLTLAAAQKGAGEKIIDNLTDPRYSGFEKWQYKTKSASGLDAVVHYVRNPKTGELLDFKFKD